MISGTLRPWGDPHWLLNIPSVATQQWHLVCCISPQDRSLSSSELAGTSFGVSAATVLIFDEAQSLFSSVSTQKTEANLKSARARLGATPLEVGRYGISDSMAQFMNAIRTVLAQPTAKNVVLDVTCIPERYLFPLLRWIFESPTVENLVVLSMSARGYTSAELAYDPSDWAPLATFLRQDATGRSLPDNVIVSAGFLALNLPDWIKKNYVEGSQKLKLSVLFPFPASPSNVSRTWEFLRQFEVQVKLVHEQQLIRIAAHDVSGCFDRVQLLLSEAPGSQAVFAPFGPKAHSVALGLCAIRANAEVWFSQPSYYHPEYTHGIARNASGTPAGNAYALRIRGREFY